MSTDFKNSIMKKIIFNVFLAMAVLLSACGTKEEAKTEASHEVSAEITTNIIEITEFQFKTAGIQLGKIEQKGLAEVITASGKLDVPPQNFAKVST